MNAMNRRNSCEIITIIQEDSRKLEDSDFGDEESFKHLKLHVKRESNKMEQDVGNKIEEYICLIENGTKSM
jgi:hypothetical protein